MSGMSITNLKFFIILEENYDQMSECDRGALDEVIGTGRRRRESSKTTHPQKIFCEWVVHEVGIVYVLSTMSKFLHR